MLSLVSISSNVIAEQIISNVECTKESFCSKSVTDKVENGIISLNLPHTLEENLKKLARQLIGKVYIYNYYMSICGVEFKTNVVSKSVFTMKRRIIDYTFSTRELVLNKHLDIKSRVLLACKFCFEEEVLAFWKSQPDIFRKLAEQGEMSVTNWLKCLEEMKEPSEEILWEDHVLLETAFLAAVKDTNLEAAEYYFKKMAAMPNDKKINILREARNSFFPDDFTLKSFFIDKMKLLVAKSQLQECIILLQNEYSKQRMLINKFDALNDKYKMLKNKKLKSEDEMLNDEDMLKDDTELFNNEYKMLEKEREMLNNELEKSANDCQIIENEYDVFLNDVRTLRTYNIGVPLE